MAEGTFVLADIGGYTSFLTEVGITHGKEITEHLLNRLIRTARRDWKVANVMGDCVFFYAPGTVSPDRIFASVRALYSAFRDAQLEIAEGSTCRCGACDRTEDLRLKFVAHAGEFDIQNIGGRKELIGPDVVLATRLLKNSVPVREYIVVTPPVSRIADAYGMSASPARDELESLGTVDYSYIDLEPVRRRYDEERQFYLTEEDARLIIAEEIRAPVSLVWEAMRDIHKRAVWQVSVERVQHLQGGINEVGEVHSCTHGNTDIVHATMAIDDAAHRQTERMWINQPMAKDIYITLFADPLSETTTRAGLLATFKPRFPVLTHLMMPVFARMMRGTVRREIAALKELCETGTVAGREGMKAEIGQP